MAASASASCSLECPICKLSLTNPTHQLMSSESENSVRSNASEDTDAGLRERLADIHSSRWACVCTPCGHLFHKACLIEWFRVQRHSEGATLIKTCPTCRKTVQYHKLTRVYLGSPEPAGVQTPPGSGSGSTSVHSSSSRLSVASAVRRFNQQLLGDLHQRSVSVSQGSQQEQRQTRAGPSNYCRVYSEFLKLLYGNGGFRRRNSGGSDAMSDAETRDSRSSSRILQNGIDITESGCENEDCIAIQNVYQVLSMEYKSLQRKYELEVDVSKMKSILVTTLQRDVDQLKMEKYASYKKLEVLWYIFFVALLVIITWMVGKAIAYYHAL